MDLFDKCKHELADLAMQQGIYPYFHELQSRQAPVVQMEGKRIIMLGSNNYLGLTTNERVSKAAIGAIEKYGTGCSGSRFMNGTLDLHIELEERLAKFLNKEAVVTFSTGFQSNLGIISALCGRGDYILNDRENHASIYDGCKLSYATTLRFRHADMDDLETQLKKIPIDAGKLIITDGIFSMRGDICKLPDIVQLAKKYNARVMVDDAHSFGVIGNGGRGTADYFGLNDEVDVIMGTFSKSLASLGGFMACSKKVAHYVRHASRPFIFSASIAPSCAASALEALNVLEENPNLPEQLLSISDYLRESLKNRGVKIISIDRTPIVPIFTYETIPTLKYGKDLFDNGVYVNPVIAPGVPEGECLLRASLMATHTKDVIDEAANIIANIVHN